MQRQLTLSGAFLLAAGVAVPCRADLGDQQLELVSSDLTTGDNFGAAVAVSGSLMLVGASDDDEPLINSGAAFLFDRSSGTQLFKLLPTVLGNQDLFGSAVALLGGTAVIGVPFADRLGADSGAVYLFDTSTGLQLDSLLPSSGQAGDLFGSSVAISGNTVIVGAPRDDTTDIDAGAAYLFDASNGVELSKLVPSDGLTGDQAGNSVGISGSFAIMGAYQSDALGTASGAAYLFDAATGAELAKLLPDDGEAGAEFGFSCAIDGNVAIVGAHKDSQMATEAGAAYLFDVATGVQIFKLTPSDPGGFDQFGYSVAIQGNTAIVGAHRDTDNGPFSGSAYLFDVHTGLELTKLLAQDGGPGDSFGGAVAIDGSTALVGATGHELNFFDAGAAYVFDATSGAVPASSVLRNGGNTNRVAFTRVTDPVVGSLWKTDVDASGHSTSVAAIEVFQSPSSGFFLSGGELLVDVSSPHLLEVIQPHFGGTTSFSTGLPPDVTLFGLSASSQVAIFGSPGYELTNALDLVLGY